MVSSMNIAVEMNEQETTQKMDKKTAIDDTEGATSDNSDKNGGGEAPSAFNYVTGWRLAIISCGLSIGLFLVNLEITVVSTALVSITNEFGEFQRGSWVITAYLITYISALVTWAKLSDLIGRKTTALSALFIFAAFSGGCGAAQSMVQLIVCRALQGIGGSGIYAVDMVILYELVPPHKYPICTALVTAVIALAFALGPLLGGLIVTSSKNHDVSYGVWRWVFLLNVPCALVSAVALFLALPRTFPHQAKNIDSSEDDNGNNNSTVDTASNIHLTNGTSLIQKLQAMDFLGASLMFIATALLITGLEEAAAHLDWSVASCFGPLCGSLVAWLAFFANSWRVTNRQNIEDNSVVQPVFPWRFCRSRVICGLLLLSFMTGAVSITCIFQLPLRYQTSTGMSPLEAGLRLIPFSVCGPIGTIICAVLSKKERLPPIYVAIMGELLQVIGLVFMSRGDPADADWHGLYGLEVVIGLGFGMSLGAATLLVPFLVKKRDLATGAAAPVQLRFLGSAVVISIVNAVGNTWLRNELVASRALTLDEISAILRSSDFISTLPQDVQAHVRAKFIEIFNLEMRIVIGFAAAGVFAALMMWQKRQVRIP